MIRILKYQCAPALFISLLPFVLGCSSVLELPTVQISQCYDGDTCTTSKGEKIRLACIDTPELRGKKANPLAAKQARDYVRARVVGKTVYISRLNTDRYGRTVAELFIERENLQRELVDTGHAKVFWKYAKQCSWTNEFRR